MFSVHGRAKGTHSVINDKRPVPFLAAVLWGYGGTASKAVIQLSAQIVLARLLGPEPYGQFSLCVIVAALLLLMIEMGLGASLVQQRDVARADMEYAWGRVLVNGLLVGGVAWIALNVWGDDILGTGVTGLLPAIFAVVALQALTVVPSALLRRALDLRRVQLAQLAGQTAGFLLVGIVLAVSGFGVWSLLIAWIVQWALAAGLLLLWQKPPLRLRIAPPTQRDGRFGRAVVATNVTNWGTENLDNYLVARWMGEQALGQYAFAYSLVRTPTNHLLSGVQQALFPAIARTGEDRASAGKLYAAALSLTLLVAAPAFAVVAVLADPIGAALLGEQWRGVGSVLAPLALAMPFQAMVAVSGSVIWGRGGAARELRIQIPVLVMLLVGVSVAAQYSIAAVGWAIVAIYAFRAFCMVALATQMLAVSGSAALLASARVCSTAIPVSLSALMAMHGMVAAGVSLGMSLACSIAAGALAWFVCVRCSLGVWLASDVVETLRSPQAPHRIQLVMRFLFGMQRAH